MAGRSHFGFSSRHVEMEYYQKQEVFHHQNKWNVRKMCFLTVPH